MKRQTQHNRATTPPSLSLNVSVTPLGSRLVVLSMVCLLVWAFQMLLAEPVKTLEERIGALGWSFNTPADAVPDAMEERLVIVAIDEESLQEVGAWPWSRQTLAQLSDRLHEYGVASQVFDLVFPESKPGDDLLNQALTRNRAVIGQIPVLDNRQKTHRAGVLSGALAAGCYPSAPQARGYLANAASVVAGASGTVATGHITPYISADGAVRFQAPVACYQGSAYPSLALSMLLQNLGASELEYQPTSLQSISSLLQPAGRLTLPDYPLISIPVDEQGLMRVSYQRSPQSFIYLSAADVLAGRVSPELLNNRWVLVGATAFGMGDLVPSPYSGLTPGVEVQARLITSILDQAVPYAPSGLWLYQGLSLGLIFLLLLVLAARSGDHQRMISRGLFMASPVMIPLLALAGHMTALQYQLWLGWTEQLLYGSSSALALIVLEYLRNRHEKQRLFDNLSSYLPEDIASQIAFHQPTGQLQAERMSCVVLSADLRNFSAFQRQSSPEGTVQLLHGFYTLASQLVEQHQGTLFELRADALLAIWPIPADGDPHLSQQQVQNAWQAAAGIQQQIQPMLRHALADELEPLGLGIGLAQGEVIRGQLGSERNRTPIILGDAVSRALGLQHMTEDLAYPTLCSTDIRQHLSEDQVQAIGRFLLPGSLRPQALFAPDAASLSHQVPAIDEEYEAQDGTAMDHSRAGHKPLSGNERGEVAHLADYRP